MRNNVVITVPLSDLSIQDLVAYEKAACSVCQKYENSLRQYDGSIVLDSKEYKNFETFNKIHISIINEMENRLIGLK